jgi:hypothetical protein
MTREYKNGPLGSVDAEGQKNNCTEMVQLYAANLPEVYPEQYAQSADFPEMRISRINIGEL